MHAECKHLPDIGSHTGYDGSSGPDWQAASHAFRQTWGEVEETDVSTAEAFKQVRACLPAEMFFHLESALWMPGLFRASDTARRLQGPKWEAQESADISRAMLSPHETGFGLKTSACQK